MAAVRGEKNTANTRSIGRVRTSITGGLKPVLRRCQQCGSVLKKVRYARDFNIYGCGKCSKTFYWSNTSHKWIELAIPYGDFFGAG